MHRKGFFKLTRRWCRHSGMNIDLDNRHHSHRPKSLKQENIIDGIPMQISSFTFLNRIEECTILTSIDFNM